MSDLSLKVNRTISAPIDDVFDAWLDASMLAKFMLPKQGMDDPSVENDPRVGGKFTINMKVGDNEIPHTGEYLEMKKPNRLAFSWVSPASRDDSVVTILFTQLDERTTKVELSHVKFIDEERRDDHEGGWAHILKTLDAVVLASAR
ncbi:MAG: SRPBCC family protein [Arenicella sp.]